RKITSRGRRKGGRPRSALSLRPDSSWRESASDTMRRTMPGRVGYVYDPLYLEHELPGHPERPDRLRAIMSHLEESGLLRQMTEVAPRDATFHELRFVHTEAMIEEVAATAGVDRHRFDADTYGSARSYEAALRAAGGTLAATEAVLRGEI